MFAKLRTKPPYVWDLSFYNDRLRILFFMGRGAFHTFLTVKKNNEEQNDSQGEFHYSVGIDNRQ